MGKVYAIQDVVKRDHNSGVMVSTMDFRKALSYGDFELLLSHGRVGFTPGPTIDTLKEKLKNFSDNDYLIPTGDPTAIAMASMIAGEANRGRVKMLKWDKDSKQYIEIQIDLNYRRNQNKEN